MRDGLNICVGKPWNTDRLKAIQSHPNCFEETIRLDISRSGSCVGSKTDKETKEGPRVEQSPALIRISLDNSREESKEAKEEGFTGYQGGSSKSSERSTQ
jgi:hypothetical protein